MLKSVSRNFFASWQQSIMAAHTHATLTLLIWCYFLGLESVTSFTLPDTFNRYTIIIARNNSTSANHVDSTESNGSNFTLLVTAPIAAGIFLTVILFFYCILFKDLTKKAGEDSNVASVENYARLPNAPDDEEPQSSSSGTASSSATNYGYVPDPAGPDPSGGYDELPGGSNNSQTTVVSIENPAA